MPFSNIIGQTAIKNRLSVSLNAENMPMLAQPLLVGERGSGKTEIADAYATALAQKMGVEVLKYNSPSEFRHVDSPEWQNLKNWFLNDKDGVLIIDEIHHINIKPTVQMTTVFNFLLKALDGQNTGKTLHFQTTYNPDGSANSTYTTFDKSRKVVILLTNHVDKVDAALMSRMDCCTMAPYTADEMEQLAVLQLSKFELAASDDVVVKMLAKSARGIGRPLYEMAKHIHRMGINMVTQEIAVKAMQQMDMFPHGLQMAEITLLEHARKPISNKVAGMLVTSLQSNIGNTVSYLAGVCRFLTLAHNGTFQLSERGAKYLKSLKTFGFIG